MSLLFRVFLVSLLFLLLFSGCSVKQPPLAIVKKRIVTLEKLLLKLSPKVNVKEAKNLAQVTTTYSYELSQKYKVVNNPWIQNMLVNAGIKSRGLCHEWAEDLLKFLVTKNYKTLDFHTVGANIGQLNEHNALSVSARGSGIEHSILLDAWRNSGILYFNVIEKDLNYKWSERVNLYGILPLKSGKK